MGLDTEIPFPSYLMLGEVQKRPLHVVVAVARSTEACYIICAYDPRSPTLGIGFQDQEDLMRCVICKHGETKPGKTTVTLQRKDTIVIVKEVPGEVCDNCGEYYLDENTTDRVLAMAEEAVKKNAEVEILRFAA